MTQGVQVVSPDKRVVVPGEEVGTDPRRAGEGTYIRGERVYSLHFGIVEERDRTRVIPFRSRYIPSRDDLVIGLVTEIDFSGWRVDINSPYDAYLRTSEHFRRVNPGDDMRDHLKPGDMILCQVIHVGADMKVDVTLRDRSLKLLREGRVADVNPTRIRRLIGRGGSMIQMVKDATGCDIQVGKNGRVWVRGGDEAMERAIDIILRIDQEAHTTGLTDRIAAALGVDNESVDSRDDRRPDPPRGEGPGDDREVNQP